LWYFLNNVVDYLCSLSPFTDGITNTELHTATLLTVYFQINTLYRPTKTLRFLITFPHS
jgi:uncharacterized membrane protein YpjA